MQTTLVRALFSFSHELCKDQDFLLLFFLLLNRQKKKRQKQEKDSYKLLSHTHDTAKLVTDTVLEKGMQRYPLRIHPDTIYAQVHSIRDDSTNKPFGA